MFKRILFISDHGDPLAPLGGEQAGGQNNYVKQLALALEKKGNQVDVITHWANPESPQVEKFGNSCRVIRIAAGYRKYVPKNEMLQILPSFYKEIRETISIPSYDIVHSHYWLSGLIGSYIKAEYNIPWIHTNHSLGIAKEQATGILEPIRLSAEEMILTSADAIVATTKNEEQLINNFVINPSPISIIAIGVHPAFRPKKRQQLQQITTPYFAFAGRLQTTKGIYTLVKAFKGLVESQGINPLTKLIIAGGDSSCINSITKLPRDIKLRSAIQGLENKIEFIGARSQNQLATLFHHAAAVIVPSFYESFGMVAAEAQACGRPVIASKVGGLSNIVKDRITGLHIQKANVADLTQAMKTILTNPNYAEKLGKKAATFAKIEFSWFSIVNKMERLYEVLIDEKKIIHVSNRSRRYISGGQGRTAETSTLL